MYSEVEIVKEEKEPMAMDPKKFALILFLVTVVMIFASLTSAYLVKKSDDGWKEFELPSVLWVSTVIIILSSVTMQLSVYSAKKDNLDTLKLSLGITTILGIGFLISQYYSWLALVEEKHFFVGNPSESFIYVLTAVHGVHIISALVFLLIFLYRSFKYLVHSKSMTGIEMCNTYWHFLGGIWIYLFIFLLANQG
jgi:cytochrome c oxidase subunit III